MNAQSLETQRWITKLTLFRFNQLVTVPSKMKIRKYSNQFCGPGGSVSIATELRAGRSGIESRWGRDFPSVQTGPGAHPVSCTTGTGCFPGVKSGRGVLLTIHFLLVMRLWKSRVISLPTLWATPGL